ncbi:MAG: zinc ribbon domain-containing protein [Clostridia bacterium]|nr:zinc ribbon domain-containing protein [Clostridia bacterium]
MITSVILITIIITIAILSVILPVAIGLYVYDDAKKRNMNGILWTLLAVFAPGFIGLIIYLIVRSEHCVLNCPKCGKNISENFSVCPGCGFSLKSRVCPTCGRTVERNWNVCPTCANEIPEDMKLKKIAKPQKDKGMKRILLLVILIPVFLCLLIIAGILIFSAEDVHVESFYATHVSPEEVYCSEIDIDKWISDCDKKGEGVYALKEVEEIYGISDVTTSLIVYRNDGMYDAEDSVLNGTHVEISYYDQATENGTGLSYFEFYCDRAVDVTIITNGETTDYEILEVADVEYSATETATETETEINSDSVPEVITEDITEEIVTF